jgi:hypothetical protein
MKKLYFTAATEYVVQDSQLPEPFNIASFEAEDFDVTVSYILLPGNTYEILTNIGGQSA